MLNLLFALSTSALDISVLTMGPGDHPFFKFGHNAIWVHDTDARRDPVYNYGMFAFDTPLLIPEFLKGRLKYWLAADSLGTTVAIYRYEKRTLQSQTLSLTEEEARFVYDALLENAKPENKFYKYDYYGDNCSTRVRDVIDKALGGALHEASKAPAEFTWRGHTRRLTQDSLVVYLALDIVMGDYIDKPIDQWEEMFLPSKLQEGLTRARRNGEPVVKQDRPLLLAPERGPLPAAPPRWHVWFALWGLAVGALWSVRHRAVRGVLALSAGTFGFFGCTFIMFWVATDHLVAHSNENMWQCAPFAIAFLWFVPNMTKHRALAGKLALGAAVASLLGLLLKVLPSMNQVNLEFICFFLPYWAGAAWGLRRG